jgi:hypothetical protein
MISIAGHVALILPNFALGSVRAHAVGVYRYLGGKQWKAVAPNQRSAIFHIGV